MSETRPPACEPAPIEALRSASHTTLLLTTNMGLEPVVAAELCERAERAGQALTYLDKAPFGSGGYVLFETAATLEQSLALARAMRSVHHVLVPLYAFSLAHAVNDQLGVIRATLATLEVPELATARSFRVTARRNGEHNFRSVDVQRAAGAALQAKYGTAVDLEDFDVEIRVDVQHERCLLGVMNTRQSLSRRLDHLARPRAALKPHVAYALLRFADLETAPETLLDPFCGSGTLLWEARALWPDARLRGSDWAADTIAMARTNARAHAVGDAVELFQADARNLGPVLPSHSVDLVVTNPPFGVQHGSGMDFRRFFRQLLVQLHGVLAPGGRAVILAYRRSAFTSALHEVEGFAIRRQRRLEVGGIYPRVFVLDRRQSPDRLSGRPRNP